MSELGRLFGYVSRCHGATVHQELSKFKVGRGMHPVLDYISGNNGCMQSDISRLSHMSPATVTVMLQSMEKNGYIVRKSDENDQRCMRIYITDLGRRIALRGKETVKKADEEFFSVLTQEEKEGLEKIFLKLKKSIDEKKMKGNPT